MGLIDSLMQHRSNELGDKEKITGKEQTGGMFDFIFRAKKRREEEIKGIQDQEDGPAATRR